MSIRMGVLTGFDENNLQFMEKHGFRSISMLCGFDSPFFPGQDGWESKAAEVKARLDAADIRLAAVCGFYSNHFDANQEKADRLADQTRKTILLAEKMGASTVCGFSGRIVGEGLRAHREPFKKLWGGHARFAADHGIRIGFECCPAGEGHQPLSNSGNVIARVDFWDYVFYEMGVDNLGLEWDPSHLICQFIDPIANVRQYAEKVYAMHVKDAKVNWDIVRKSGILAHDAIVHCHAGFGDTDWHQVVKILIAAGYNNDFNIEGWHDDVFNDRPEHKREHWGWLITKKLFEPYLQEV